MFSQMADETLESLTKAVLTMSAALLLHYSETFSERFRKKKSSRKTIPTNGSPKHAQHVSFGVGHDVPSSASRFTDTDVESYRLVRPTVPLLREVLRDASSSFRSYTAPPSIKTPVVPYKFIRTTPLHHSSLASSPWPSYFRSPPPSPESERSFRLTRVPRAPPGYDYSAKFERDHSYPVAYTARSPHRSPQPGHLFIDDADSSTPSESEVSLRVVHPFSGNRSRDRIVDPYLYRSYSTLPSSAIATSRRLPQQYVSPQAVPLEQISFPEYDEPSSQAVTDYSNGYPEELDSGDLPEDPLYDPLGEYDESQASIQETLNTTFALPSPSLSSRSPARSSPGTTFETDSVRFPNLSRLPPTPRGTSLASDLQSPSAVRAETINQSSRQENLAEVSSGPFAPELNSTFVTDSRAGVDSLEETINTLIAKINRQAEIIRAGGRPAEHERIGVIRRKSEDFDTETGRMKDLK
ncbi:uncharacterized protein LOC129761504 [Toxorhynchites rutilus septentrionalis]|uniref:uncharacterized protein LOC129761504 n=1 Tax=Toxorhynchites rutilus septentrionalis TaxID=329112 RepID=UPI00247930E8|nr:uncharacterized protein LOC129761504 [Toxorhynchites rutilus septentrionalis]